MLVESGLRCSNAVRQLQEDLQTAGSVKSSLEVSTGLVKLQTTLEAVDERLTLLERAVRDPVLYNNASGRGPNATSAHSEVL